MAVFDVRGGVYGCVVVSGLVIAASLFPLFVPNLMVIRFNGMWVRTACRPRDILGDRVSSSMLCCQGFNPSALMQQHLWLMNFMRHACAPTCYIR